MSGEVQPTDLQNKVLGSITETADEAYQKMLAKKAEYEAAKNQLSLFVSAKEQAFKKFRSIQENCTNKNDYSYRTAEAEYSSVLSNYTNADSNVDILRGSLLNSIFYSGKMNTSALLAESALA